MHERPASGMKILVVSTYYSPDVCGIAPIVSDLCNGLAAKGHAVTVLTSFPHYPEWKNKARCRPWSIRTEHQANGIEVIRHGAFIPKRPANILFRLCYEVSLLISLSRSLRFRIGEFDMVYAVCPSVGNLMFARFRAFFSGEPVVINVQDIPADAASASGLAIGSISRAAAAFQKWMFKFGQSLTTISTQMVQRIREVTDKPVLLTPNWLVGDIADEVTKANERRELSVPQHGSVPKLFYSGNIGNKQGLVGFCSKLSSFDLPFHFTIHGCGSAYRELQEWYSQNGDDRITLGVLLDSAEFVDHLRNADWFVITEKAGMGAAVMPSKLIPAVSLGIPVLAICDSDGALGKIVSEHQIGLSLEWSSLDGLARTLSSISMKDHAAFSSNCLTLAHTFDRDVNITAIERVLLDARVTPELAPVTAV